MIKLLFRRLKESFPKFKRLRSHSSIGSLTKTQVEKLRKELVNAEHGVVEAEKKYLEGAGTWRSRKDVLPQYHTAWKKMDELEARIQEEFGLRLDEVPNALHQLRGRNKPALHERIKTLQLVYCSKNIDDFINRVKLTQNVTASDIDKVKVLLDDLYDIDSLVGFNYLKRLKKLDLPWGHHKTFDNWTRRGVTRPST